jgi:5-methylcytosine-specific restriction protein A
MKAKQIPAAVRKALRDRSRGLCEIHGDHPAHHAHHRRPRGMGGSRDEVTNSLENLLHINAVCHAWIESYREEALKNGWIVRQSQDPRLRPVLYRGVVVFLDASEPTGMRLATPEQLMLAGYGYQPNSEDMGGEVA